MRTRMNGVRVLDDRVWSNLAQRLVTWLEDNMSQREFDSLVNEETCGDRYKAFEKLPARTFSTLWAYASAINPEVAFIISNSMAPTDLNFVGQIPRMSETVEEAFKMAELYWPIGYPGIRGRLMAEEGGYVSYRLEYLSNGRDIIPMTEYHLLTIIRLIDEGTDGKFKTTRAEFFYDEPSHNALYRRHFSEYLKFGGLESKIVFDSAFLSLKMSQFNPNVNSVLRSCADGMIKELGDSSDVTKRVKLVAFRIMASDGALNLTQVCAEMGMSSSTLKKILHREGYSWRKVVDDVRRETAIRGMKGGKTLSQIAGMLGYSEPTTLSHSVRRWFNMSFRDARVSLRNGEAIQGDNGH